MALLMVVLVREHGQEYLLAATLLCGVLQILASHLKLGSLMRVVSRSVVVDLSRAHFWDITAVSSMDIVDRFALHDKPDTVDKLSH